MRDIHVRLIGTAPARQLAAMWLPHWCLEAATRNDKKDDAEIEFAFAGLGGEFSSACPCRILIVPPGQHATSRLAKGAMLVFADSDSAGPRQATLPLSELRQFFTEQLGFREPSVPVLSRVLQVA